jgi:hypothetical protein
VILRLSADTTVTIENISRSQLTIDDFIF